MASRPVHIADFRAAIAAGEIPGTFAPDRTAFVFPDVVSENSRGASLVWRVKVRAVDGDGRPVPIAPEWLTPGAEVPAGVAGEVSTESYQVKPDGTPGKTRAGGVPTVVKKGKNIGKANATNPVTQALRDALGKYNAHRRRAGPAVAANAAAADAADAADAGGRRLLQPPPMLVKGIGETVEARLTPEVFARGVTVQRKFNGVRLVAHRDPDSGDVRLYSRTRGDYPGLRTIRAELAGLLADPPPVPARLWQLPVECVVGAANVDDRVINNNDGAANIINNVYLDGELYAHGRPLQWISGQARREDDEDELVYCVFDCFFPEAKKDGHDMASANRQRYLDLVFAADAAPHPHIARAENFPVATLEDVERLAREFVAEGYEGAIARKDCKDYRYSPNGYHSANAVKIKPLYDSEFKVVGYTQGKKGKDKGAVIWEVEVDPEHMVDPNDKTFSVVPKEMSYQQRYQVYRCLGERVDAPGGARTRFERDFLGQPLTVEYPERSSKTGKPVRAKALTFRTYEGGPDRDPLRRLFDECAAA